MMNRTTFLIDGFNLYHSLIDANQDLRGKTTKWLDIKSLCSNYLAGIGNKSKLERIYYFSALAEHLQSTDPGKVQRHLKYIECLKSTGIMVELGRFKPRSVWCDKCNSQLIRHEEKETDVAISIKLFEVFMNDECETAVIVTGDTDLAPAMRSVKRLFPGKTVCSLFPYKRKNYELSMIVHQSFKIKKERYIQNQFPDPVILKDGRRISKPASW